VPPGLSWFWVSRRLMQGSFPSSGLTTRISPKLCLGTQGITNNQLRLNLFKAKQELGRQGGPQAGAWDQDAVSHKITIYLSLGDNPSEGIPSETVGLLSGNPCFGTPAGPCPAPLRDYTPLARAAALARAAVVRHRGWPLL